jgi:hypothetical protein
LQAKSPWNCSVEYIPHSRPSHDQHTKEANKALHKEIDGSFSIQTIQIMPLETS